MSLFKLDVSKTTGRGTHLFGTATEILYNGEGVYGLTSDGTLKAKFFYNLNVKNDKEGTVRVEADESATSIRSSINEDFLEKFITLTVYIDAVSSSDTETYTILSKNICFAYDVDMGAVYFRFDPTNSDDLAINVIGTGSIEEVLSIIYQYFFAERYIYWHFLNKPVVWVKIIEEYFCIIFL